ncbi:hypothetical protein DPMN_010936 [Dreissena polymorpha]|uniref:Uncharacterized protein n=1 Tax=Dreissena polymorpha TaxID=45954 RepID=A0A9D4MZL9_DREPO|nr:hypothetical protein DPMN_010936 [Dreissena polymorpha]
MDQAIHGLDKQIKSHVLMKEPKSMDELINIAKMAESAHSGDKRETSQDHQIKTQNKLSYSDRQYDGNNSRRNFDYQNDRESMQNLW